MVFTFQRLENPQRHQLVILRYSDYEASSQNIFLENYHAKLVIELEEHD